MAPEWKSNPVFYKDFKLSFFPGSKSTVYVEIQSKSTAVAKNNSSSAQKEKYTSLKLLGQLIFVYDAKNNKE